MRRIARTRGIADVQPREPRRSAVVTALGITQIFAWGCSYYLPAVLAKPITAGTGWPLPWVVGGVSIGLFVAGLVSPLVGRTIQRCGGRAVLALSSILLALGLVGIGLAQNLIIYLAAWIVIGLGMGAGLYDAAFATLGQIYRDKARSPDHWAPLSSDLDDVELYSAGHHGPASVVSLTSCRSWTCILRSGNADHVDC